MVTIDEHVYASMDFKAWSFVGQQKAWTGGECRSCFPRPRSTSGSGPPPPNTQLPTHFHKSGGIHDGVLDTEPEGNGPIGSANGGDWYAAGIYEAGAPTVLGNFTAPGHGNHGDANYQCLNHNDDSYAAKDFEDSKHGRRINHMWANLDPSCLTLPRELSWHNELQMLVQSPLPEMALLHDGLPLATITVPTAVPDWQQTGGFLPLNVVDKATGVSKGNTSDIKVSFDLAGLTGSGRFGVVFGANASASSNASNGGKLVYVDYVANAASLQVGIIDGGVKGARVRDAAYSTSMMGYDLPPLPNLQSWYRPLVWTAAGAKCGSVACFR